MGTSFAPLAPALNVPFEANAIHTFIVFIGIADSANKGRVPGDAGSRADTSTSPTIMGLGSTNL